MLGERFTDRRAAGRALAELLVQRLTWTDPLVLGLVRGGVPVAYEVARAIGADLDVAIALKIGAPGQPEFGIGAVTPHGEPRYDPATLAALRLSPDALRGRAERVREEARRREALYRDDRPEPPVRDRSVVVVDDGLATGVTARAAVMALRPGRPRDLVLAVPVGAHDSAQALRADRIDVCCVREPIDFGAVGSWYRNFDQTADEEVLALLDR